MASNAPDEQFRSIWQDAEKSYEEETGVLLAGMKSPGSAQELQDQITSRHKDFADGRGKGDKILHWIRVSLQPIQALGAIAAGAASSVRITIELSHYWTAAHALAGIPPFEHDFWSYGVSAGYDAILDLFTQLESFLTRLKIYTNAEPSPDLRVLLTKILRTLLVVIGLQTKIVRKMAANRFKSYFKEVATGVGGSHKKIQAELVNLNALMSEEGKLVGGLTYGTVITVDSKLDSQTQKLDSMKLSLETTIATLNKTKDDPKREREQKLKKTLKPSFTVIEMLDKRCRERLSGTCEWIKQRVKFRAWLEGHMPILWISGKGGIGKTFLSTKIIEDLLHDYPQGVQGSSRVSVAYYFFEDDPHITTMLRTMAFLVAKNDPIYAKHILDTEDLEDTSLIRPLWRNLFEEPFGQQPGENSAILIIDGLDDDAKKGLADFLELIKDYQTYVGSERALRLQLLFVGRSEGNLTTAMEDVELEIPTIGLSAEDNRDDIDDYIAFKLKKAKNLRKEQDRQHIIETIRANADGMFRYVSLTIKEITHKRMVHEMLETLKLLPKGLDEALHHILEKFSAMDELEIRDLNTFLEWTACSQEEVSVRNLDSIIKYETGDEDGYAYLEHDLRKKFASLFTLRGGENALDEDVVDSSSSSETDGAEDDEGLDVLQRNNQKVEFEASLKGEDAPEGEPEENDSALIIVKLDHSMKEYFEKHGKGDTNIGVCMKASHLKIARECMALICDDWEQWAEDWLGRYACGHFYTHLTEIDPNSTTSKDKEAISGYLIRLFRHPEVIARWVSKAGPLEFLANEWLVNEAPQSIIYKWLMEPGDWRPDNPDDQVWLAQLSKDPVAFAGVLLRPLALEIARLWLKTDEVVAAEGFAFVHAYLEMVSIILMLVNAPGAVNRSPGSARLNKLPDLRAIDEECILESAKWSGFEEDVVWTCRVAQASFNDHFLALVVLKQDPLPGTAIAYFGLAKTFIFRKDYTEAINCLKKAQDLLPKDDIIENCGAYSLRAYCHRELGQDDLAIENMHNELGLWTGAVDIVEGLFSFLLFLDQKRRYKEMIALFKEFHGEALPDGNSKLIDSILFACKEWGEDNLLPRLRAAAQKEGQLGFALKIQKASIRAAKLKRIKGPVAQLRNSLAMFYYRFINEEEKAIKLWRRVMEDPAVICPTSRWHHLRGEAAQNLALHYFTKALVAKKADESSTAFVEALEHLCTQNSGGRLRLDDCFSTKDTTLFLSAWYRLDGQTEKARACVKEHIVLALDLLTDDDDTNDIDGFRRLGMNLLKAHDEENVKRAFSMIQQHTRARWIEGAKRAAKAKVDILACQDEKTTPSQTQTSTMETSSQPSISGNGEENPRNDSNVQEGDTTMPSLISNAEIWLSSCSSNPPQPYSQSSLSDFLGRDELPSCNGGCKDSVLAYDSNHNFCRYCLDVDFCNSCARRLKAGEVGFGCCDKEHEMYNVGDLIEEEGVGKGMVKLGKADGEKIVPWPEWIKLLKKEWTK
ncbi:MAG: hypothetical protein M1819_007119 [Sarea resinae]|nr:MAG: hypothetical protein M1819_007119 [Sarea resinae]